MSKPGATVTINAGASQIWVADQATLMNISFGAGDQSQETTWTGQITVTTAPASGDEFTAEIGYADDQNGNGFSAQGTQATLNGDDSTKAFIFATTDQAFIVPQGRYIALKITNNNSSNDYDVQVGGSWSYVSAPIESYFVKIGDVSDNGEVTAYDAALIYQHLAGLISFTSNQLDAADVNDDGDVTDEDATLILKKVVGLIQGF